MHRSHSLYSCAGWLCDRPNDAAAATSHVLGLLGRCAERACPPFPAAAAGRGAEGREADELLVRLWVKVRARRERALWGPRCTPTVCMHVQVLRAVSDARDIVAASRTPTDKSVPKMFSTIRQSPYHTASLTQMEFQRIDNNSAYFLAALRIILVCSVRCSALPALGLCRTLNACAGRDGRRARQHRALAARTHAAAASPPHQGHARCVTLHV